MHEWMFDLIYTLINYTNTYCNVSHDLPPIKQGQLVSVNICFQMTTCKSGGCNT